MKTAYKVSNNISILGKGKIIGSKGKIIGSGSPNDFKNTKNKIIKNYNNLKRIK